MQSSLQNFTVTMSDGGGWGLMSAVSSERDTRPLLIRSPYGRLVLAEYDKRDNKSQRQHFYQVLTFVPNSQRIGTFIGYYKSAVENLNNTPYNVANHKELDSLDNTQLVECQ